jgi:hypothetical protein
MNFEIAPEEFHKKLSLEEAQIYCFSLNIDGKTGWRLPTYNECIIADDALGDGWNQKDIGNEYFTRNPTRYYCYPVRDLR